MKERGEIYDFLYTVWNTMKNSTHEGLTATGALRGGLVQIPYIGRNAAAAMRAINAMSLANFLVGSRKISFDLVIKTMY